VLVRIVYLSAAVGPQTETMTQAILKKSRSWNTAHGITGVLCQGQGVFLQALEGERRAVNQLYARICADPRHNNVEILHCESILERRYGSWSMAFVHLSDVDPSTKIDWPEFDPYSAAGSLVLARIDELLATGTAIH